MVAGGIASAASARAAAPSDQCSGPTVSAVRSVSCPGAPTLLIPKVGSSQVTLFVDEVAVSDGGSSISGYTVYQGTSPAGGSGPPYAAGQPDPLHRNRPEQRDHVLLHGDRGQRVGKGKPSNRGARPPVAVPGAPAGLAATPGDGQVTLSWTAPASDGGSPVSGYNVYQGTSPGGKTGTPVNGLAGHRHQLHGDRPDQRDHVLLQGDRGQPGGEGGVDEVPAVPVTVPGAPAGLTATAGDGQVTLSWAAPASDGGSPVTGYNVYKGTSPVARPARSTAPRSPAPATR